MESKLMILNGHGIWCDGMNLYGSADMIQVNHHMHKSKRSLDIENKYYKCSIDVYFLDSMKWNSTASASAPAVAAEAKQEASKGNTLHGQATSSSSVAEAESMNENSKNESNKGEETQHLEESQALMIVIDDKIPNSSKNFMKHWESEFDKGGKDKYLENIESKLICIINGDKLDQGFQDWCLDNFFEVVPITIPQSSTLLSHLLNHKELNKADVDKEQDIPRILEALSVVMWKGMQKKEISADKPSSAASSMPAASASAVTSTTEKANSGEIDASKQTMQASSKTESKKGPEGSKKASKSVSSPSKKSTKNTSASSSATGSGQKKQEKISKEMKNENVEKELDSFEAMMMQMAEAKKKLQGLSDAERREKAAELVLQMVSQLGLDEDDI